VRAPRRSVLLAVSLHAGLVAVLLAWKLPAPPPEGLAPIEATLVRFDRGAELDRDNGRAASAPTPEPPSAETTPEPLAREMPEAPAEPRPASLLEEPTEAPPPPESLVDAPAPPTGPVPPVNAAVESSTPPADETPAMTVADASLPAPPIHRPASAAEQRLLREQLERAAANGSGHGQQRFRGKDGREYSAELRHVPATGDLMGFDQVLVTLSTEDGGNRLTTRLRMKRLAFSSYAQLVDRWDPAVQIHDDVIDGRFHSNSAIKVRYSAFTKPTFLDLVTTSAHEVATDGIGRLDKSQMFRGGLETGVRRIGLPREFTPIVAEAAQVERVAGTVRLTFHEEGDYTITPLKDDAPPRRGTIDTTLYVLGLDASTDVHVSGTLRGRALVYTPGRIVIEDDVRYADYPELAPDARDFLGLVADRNVEIASPDVTGPGDLLVTASIYARKQFAVRSYRARDGGTLRIFGSIAAGSITATEPRFATQIRYDSRLESLRAPGFPLTDRYEVEEWDGVWRVETDAAPPSTFAAE
jgi:hypothetical protein